MPPPQQHGEENSGSLKSHFVFGVIGTIAGVSLSQNVWGVFSGFCLGLLFSNWNSNRDELRYLRRVLSAVESRQAEILRRVGGATSDETTDRDVESEAESDQSDLATPIQAAPAPGSMASTETPSSSAASTPAATPPPSSLESSPPEATDDIVWPKTSEPSAFDELVGTIRNFFFGQNTIVRVGLLVLLVGLTLLAKYAVENSILPVEVRLSFAALVGLGLVGIGFRVRETRPGFGLSLQGGGIAALYVVTFFAFRFYGLLPAGLAFALFLGLAAATAILATLQASQPLLVIGSLGGFLAPVLASTGEGNHVALFGYYVLLIISIAYVAWQQTWRIPAIVAFVCTYVVAGAWGVLRYEPENFSTTVPFVVAFMFLFTGIAVLHAWRRPPELRGFVDGTLVFGTPLISIMLQGNLVEDRELGLALSAAGFGLFYAIWALILWRAAPREVRPLAEAFIAIAVGFETMAIPFAFDEALTTSIAWALEGAGLYWIGARQSRPFARFAGVTLQILAGLAFFASASFDQIDTSAFAPIANGRALSCFALAIAGMFIARRASISNASNASNAGIGSSEFGFAQFLGAWGLAWWTGGSIAEINQFVPVELRPSACLVWLACTMVCLEWGARRSGWETGRLLALAGLPGAALLLLPTLEHVPHLLADGGWLAWPMVFAAFQCLWMRLEPTHDRWLLPFRAGAAWLLAIVSALALTGLAAEGFDLARDWGVAGFGIAVASVLWISSSLLAREISPFDRAPGSALKLALAPVAAFALVSIMVVQFNARGDASPLPHVPLLNPADLVVWLLALSIWRWWREFDFEVVDELGGQRMRPLILLLLVVAFASLNGTLARTVHQWADVPFDFDALWGSSQMQVTLSIAWTLVGMIGMLVSSRRGWRPAWMGFAGLLGLVVAKLFTVDLSQLGTLVRIGTFLAVGALMLVLGYVSPVPPSSDADDGADDNPGVEPTTAPLGDGS